MTSRTRRTKRQQAPRLSGIDRLRADRRVEIVDDERQDGGNLVITMEPGWRLDPSDPSDGVFGADTLTEAWETLRRATFHEPLAVAA
jgi:hypothetical protein